MVYLAVVIAMLQYSTGSSKLVDRYLAFIFAFTVLEKLQQILTEIDLEVNHPC